MDLCYPQVADSVFQKKATCFQTPSSHSGPSLSFHKAQKKTLAEHQSIAISSRICCRDVAGQHNEWVPPASIAVQGQHHPELSHGTSPCRLASATKTCEKSIHGTVIGTVFFWLKIFDTTKSRGKKNINSDVKLGTACQPRGTRAPGCHWQMKVCRSCIWHPPCNSGK